MVFLLFNTLGCSPDGNGDDDPTPTPTALAQVTATPLPTSAPTPTTTPRQLIALVLVNGNGVPFGGTITDAAGNSRTVEGFAPDEFTALAHHGGTVVGSFSKRTAGKDVLQAEITFDGQRLAFQSTNSEFGSVTVVATIP